ncbi:MAG: hypothetical protein ABWZ82_06500 [Candidatus Limnocylindrales bacterium]|jgi:hypothetical protein
MHDPSDPIELVTRALAAYDELVALAEEVEDEWSYVQDLAGAWRAELERAGAEAAPGAAAAIDRLADEVTGITDPHRAIDWLSTYPQAVLLALGVDPWAAA